MDLWKWEAEGPAKAVMVLVHSAYEHHMKYAWLIEQWRASGFHVIMGDLPGHGRGIPGSKPHNEAFSDYEKSVEQAIAVALENELPVFVLGHGLGATIAMNVLSGKAFPIAGVVLSSPWLHLLKTPSVLTSAFSNLGSLRIDHALKIEDLTSNPESIESESGDPFYRTVVTMGWYRELHAYMKKSISAKRHFPDIPVMVQTAGNDRVADKSYAKRWLHDRQLGHFSYKEWTGCSHDLFLEQQREEIFAANHSFVKDALRLVGYVVN